MFRLFLRVLPLVSRQVGWAKVSLVMTRQSQWYTDTFKFYTDIREHWSSIHWPAECPFTNTAIVWHVCSRVLFKLTSTRGSAEGCRRSLSGFSPVAMSFLGTSETEQRVWLQSKHFWCLVLEEHRFYNLLKLSHAALMIQSFYPWGGRGQAIECSLICEDYFKNNGEVCSTITLTLADTSQVNHLLE